MDELSKEKLYSQLEEMAGANIKEDAEPIISREDFFKLSDGDILKYVFRYRDRQTKFNDDMEYYIELPDMDLEGSDLRGLYLSKFRISTLDKDLNIIPSTINLKNTNATVNISDIGSNSEYKDESNIRNYVVDFSKLNLMGCDVLGRLPDEIAEIQDPNFRIAVTNEEEGLPTEYLERRRKCKLRPEIEKINARAYKRLVSGKGLDGMRQIGKIDFTDYDLSDVDIRLLISAYEKYNVRFYNVGIAPINKTILDDLRKELPIWQFYSLLHLLEKGYLKCDIDNLKEFRLELFSSIKGMSALERKMTDEKSFYTLIYAIIQSIETIDEVEALMSSKAFQDYLDTKHIIYSQWRKEYEPFKHWVNTVITLGEEIKRNSAFEKAAEKKLEEVEKATEKKLEERDISFLENMFNYLDISYRNRIVKVLYQTGDIDFAINHFDEVDGPVQEEIIEDAMEKNNTYMLDYVLEFAEPDLKKRVVRKLWDEGDIEFARKNIDYADKLLQKEIVENAWNQGNTEFAREYIWYADRLLEQEIVQDALKRGYIEYASKYIWFADYPVQKDILKRASAKRYDISMSFMEEFIEKALEYGDLQFVQDNLVEHVKKSKCIKFLLNSTDEDVEKFIDKLQSIYGKPNKFSEKELLDYLIFSLEETMEKKMILDACSFDINKVEEDKKFFIATSIFITNVSDMYARYKFFKEQGITIDPEKPEQTLFITPKGFFSRYGDKIMSKEEKEGKEEKENLQIDDIVVKQKLREKYPLPESTEKMMEEFKKEKNRSR